MLEIDNDRLLTDLYYTKNAFNFNCSKDNIKNDYSSFITLNDVLGSTFGRMFPTEGFYTSASDLDKILVKETNTSIQNFAQYAVDNSELIRNSLKNFNNYLKSIKFRYIPNDDLIRGYNEKDFKDIILSYFNTYGDKYYKIAKKYFDENRIHIGYTPSKTLGKENIGGFFAHLTWLESGYIISVYDKYNTWSMGSIVHELGHAIDAELFIFPQQKVMSVFSDTLLEVPSTTFEMGLFDYLINNKIDFYGGLLHFNDRIALMQEYYKTLDELHGEKDIYLTLDGIVRKVTVEVINPEDALIDENGHIFTENDNSVKTACYDEDGNILLTRVYEYPFRNAILYSLGYYIAMHLNNIKDNDLNEFNKIVNNIITSRKEASLEEIIEMMGISIEEFESCKLIRNKIKNNTKVLKKRFNMNY